MKIRLYLPAYNEEKSISSLLSKIQQAKDFFKMPLDVIVVNDGSVDRTSELAKNAGVEVIEISPNQGLANGVRTALRHGVSTLNENDIVFIMDADDSHTPFLLNRMVMQILEGSDVVIASRYRKGSRVVGLSKFRELLSMGAALVFILFKNIKGVRDYTCGYRAYRISVLKKAFDVYGEKLIEQKGFGCMAELLIKLNKIGAIFHEVPFILRYDQKLSDSKIKIGKTIRQTLRLIFQ